MRSAEPPRLSTWLLERLGPHNRLESVVGDLREQLQRGRSAWWYRRQVLGTILTGLAEDLASHKLLAVRALAVGWSAMLLMYQIVGPLMQHARITLFSRWGSALWGDSEVLRQLWVYYSLPFQLVICLAFVALGWMVAASHRRLPGIVFVFSATLLVPATLQLVDIRRALQTDLWPGWGWGAYRWAVLYQGWLSLVAYPLCVLFGGLWNRTPDSAR